MNCEKLIQAGIDMDDFLKRLMGNEMLVKRFIQKFVQDENFTKLVAAFDQEDVKAAEMASHTLKGMCGNLSIKELYMLFTEQVRRIRSGEYAEAKAMMPEITACYQRAVDGMSAFLAGN